MKLNKKYLETIIFVILYMATIYLWTMPIQNSPLPYGEFDAISHVQVADYMSQSDKSLVYLPPYIDTRYGNDNYYKKHTLWYHPPFHTDFAIMQIVGGERIVPIYVTNAIFATLILVSVYFVMRKLFGFFPAILSSLLLMFSPRDFMPFLWGQWPERLAYAYIPLIMYCFYKYFISEKKNKPVYAYIMSLLLAVNMLIHPLVFFHSVFGLIVLAILMVIKERKFPFNLKHILISIMIIVLLLAIFPVQTGNVIVAFKRDSSSKKEVDVFSRLFQWSLNPEDYSGSVPPNYFSFKEMHGTWTMPFIFLGIIFLIFRRERRNLFLLAWVISLYLVMHRDLIGKLVFLHRSLSASAHIFAPLTAIGMLYIPSIFKLPKKYKSYLKYAIVIIFIFLAINVNGRYAYPILKNAYGGISRMNQAQLEVSSWLLENTEEDQNATIIGTPIFKRTRWIAAMSQRITNYVSTISLDDEKFVNRLMNDYTVMDYSDLVRLNDQQAISQLQAFESAVLSNHSLLYDRNNIRVYKYG